MASIDICGVWKACGDVDVIHGVNIAIEDGAIVVLAGAPAPYADRPGDVLELDLAAVDQLRVGAMSDTLLNDAGDAYAPRFRLRLQPRRDVDAVAINVVVLKDDFSQD